jgi:hypothetical protein
MNTDRLRKVTVPQYLKDRLDSLGMQLSLDEPSLIDVLLDPMQPAKPIPHRRHVRPHSR